MTRDHAVRTAVFVLITVLCICSILGIAASPPDQLSSPKSCGCCCQPDWDLMNLPCCSPVAPAECGSGCCGTGNCTCTAEMPATEHIPSLVRQRDTVLSLSVIHLPCLADNDVSVSVSTECRHRVSLEQGIFYDFHLTTSTGSRAPPA